MVKQQTQPTFSVVLFSSYVKSTADLHNYTRIPVRPQGGSHVYSPVTTVLVVRSGEAAHLYSPPVTMVLAAATDTQ